MTITDFTACHIEQAVQIAKQNYDTERDFVPALPVIDKMPDLTAFAENGLGAAAIDNGNLIGFICSVPLIDRPYQIEGIRGAYVPLYAHGAVTYNRSEVYARMYQYAADKWVKAGALNHAITLYAHDSAVIDQFFQYRFGMHGMDAVRETSNLEISAPQGYTFFELSEADGIRIWHLHNLLCEHFLQSPMFLHFPFITEEEFAKSCIESGERYFAAEHDGTIAAYIKLSPKGETFVSHHSYMANITGAYLLKEHRNRGVYSALLSYMLSVLKQEGQKLTGVDFESFNPTAYGFWLKYFTAYTHSLVRRIN